MTQETAPSVDRLDFTKPPPGLTVFFDDGTSDDDVVDVADGWYYGDDTFDTTPTVWNDGRPLATEVAAIAAAWGHYKGKHDPPGDGLMTQETAPSVERLDFTTPPLGYEVDLDDDQEVNPGLWTWSADGGRTRGAEPQEAEYEALEDAWSHYKGEHDPPGMETWNEAEGPPGGVWMVATLGESGYFADERSQDDARAAAWSWYETRLALADKLDTVRADAEASRGIEMPSRPLPAHHWPRGLTWSEEQVSEVERWLVDSTAEMPEVLRG